MTTIMDVANKANVSKMTVSRVINHPDKVSEELKQLVYQAMQELNYQPNIIAKALVNRSTRIIKLCILEDIDTTEPYYMNLILGVAKALDSNQYSLQLVTRKNFDIGNCDGYIITGLRKKDVDWVKQLKKPFILFGENHYGLDYVDTNNQAGIYLASQIALDRGYKKLVYIGIKSSEGFEKSRESGYLKKIHEEHLTSEIHCFNNHGHLTEQFIDQNLDKLVKNTAFICASDRLAIGIERGLLKHGYNIPDDFGITGFDGVFLNQIASPKITTIRQSIVEMGSICSDTLLAKINGKTTKNALLLEPKISWGDTLRD